MLMSQVMVMSMVLLVVLSGVGSGVDEGYYPPGTGAAWQPALPPRNSLSPAPIVDALRRVGIITDDIL